MKKINELINCPYDIDIYGIKTNSKKVKKGDLFIAVKGYKTDHHEFIDDAIKNGAVAIISEKKLKKIVPVIVVKSTNKALQTICANFYEQKTWKTSFIGITGTDGKTTTATMIKQILDNYLNCAYIGTNGVIYKDNNISSNNTTPIIEELYSYLYEINKNNCQTVSMEVSSESLLHNRVDGIKFDVVIVTNVTEDHLNIHKTLKNYLDSKIKILKLVKKDGFIILNRDDKYYYKFIKKCKSKVYTYGTNKMSNFVILNVKQKNKYTYFDIEYNDQIYHIKSLYPGMYNVYNLTAAFITCFLKKINSKNLIKNISCMNPIIGRGEYLNFNQKYKIILDYAHTVNATKNIMDLAQKSKKHKIITVVGSAGGRETQKRKLIGEIVLKNSDLVIFTMDDPRYEDVEDIIDDMLGESQNTNYLKIINRKEAIFKAFDIAVKNDIVLILGKGRDNYMAIENEKIQYCDYDVIKEYFT